MKSESIAFTVAGMAFGLIAGWVIGTDQAAPRNTAATPTQGSAPSSAAPSSGAAPRAALLDEAQVGALKSMAEGSPSNPKPRVDLANLYFDAERYSDAIGWYADALKLNPKDVDVSTDLGVAYYYTNQPDKALAEFDRSLKLNAKHLKTLLNVGIVKAFGKQDLAGASQAWQQVIDLSPEGPEGQAARRALDSLRSAHPAGDSRP